MISSGAEIKNETPIGADLVRNLLGGALKSRQRLPDKIYIQALTSGMESIRLQCIVSKKFKFYECRNHYLSESPRQNLRRFVSYDYGLSTNIVDPDVIETAAGLLASLDRFETALTRSEANNGGIGRPLTLAHKVWHDVVAQVATHFAFAMKDQCIGTANYGPVARFVAAIMPYITGETATAGAVSKRLKDIARATRSEKSGVSSDGNGDENSLERPRLHGP